MAPSECTRLGLRLGGAAEDATAGFCYMTSTRRGCGGPLLASWCDGTSLTGSGIERGGMSQLAGLTEYSERVDMLPHTATRGACPMHIAMLWRLDATAVGVELLGHKKRKKHQLQSKDAGEGDPHVPRHAGKTSRFSKPPGRSTTLFFFLCHTNIHLRHGRAHPTIHIATSTSQRPTQHGPEVLATRPSEHGGKAKKAVAQIVGGAAEEKM